ncbi:MAG: hypothetical protein E6J06_06680 [Chloroflexi bacterium]|nr:MAG: hypothetical protein E6J06_06680 [Chloroflexota bacterium]
MTRDRARPTNFGRDVLFAFGVYLLAFLLVFGVDKLGQADYSTRIDDLVAHSASGSATVTSVEQHNSICYGYVENGSPYSACGEAPGDNWGGLKVGSSVAIVYDPTDPAISCACDPRSEQSVLSNGPLFFGAFAGLVATVAFLIWWWGPWDW